MNAQQRLEPPPDIVPFNALAAYERERAYSKDVERKLSKALALLSMECNRRTLRGEDVSHIEAFIAEARA